MFCFPVFCVRQMKGDFSAADSQLSFLTNAEPNSIKTHRRKQSYLVQCRMHSKKNTEQHVIFYEHFPCLSHAIFTLRKKLTLKTVVGCGKFLINRQSLRKHANVLLACARSCVCTENKYLVQFSERLDALVRTVASGH